MDDIRQYEPLWGAWHVDSLIGEGSFGKVYKVRREEFGNIYYSAVKIITIPQNEADIRQVRREGMDQASVRSYFHAFVTDIIQEINLMSEFRGNSNIVSFEDHKVIEKTDEIGWDILIRMELLTSLADHFDEKLPPPAEVIRLGIHICRALELCAMHNTIHRDIKPDNIFISRYGEYKLGDFGIARQIERTTSGLSKKGTYTYMAPEVFKGDEYGSSVDMYSLGIVMYRYLNKNRIPFLPDFPAAITPGSRDEALQRRMKGEPLPPIPGIDPSLNEIVQRACAFDRNGRYTSPTEMRKAFEAISGESNFTPVATPIVGRDAHIAPQASTDDRTSGTDVLFGEKQKDSPDSQNENDEHTEALHTPVPKSGKHNYPQDSADQAEETHIVRPPPTTVDSTHAKIQKQRKTRIAAAIIIVLLAVAAVWITLSFRSCGTEAPPTEIYSPQISDETSAEASATPKVSEVPDGTGELPEASEAPEAEVAPDETSPSPEVNETLAEEPASPEADETPAEASPSPEVDDTPAETTPSPVVSEAPAETSIPPVSSEIPAETSPSPPASETPAETTTPPPTSETLPEVSTSPVVEETPTEIPKPATGDTIEFGGYEWRVLAVQDNKALLLSRYVIENRAYHNIRESVTWATCDLRKYLNSTFYDRFSTADRERIIQTTVANNDNQWFETSGGGGSATTDRIFLLSLGEVVQYFGDSGQLGNRPAENTAVINDQYNSYRIATEASGDSSWWWLRSPGVDYYGHSAAGVSSVGTIDVIGGSVEVSHHGVRPALWLNLES